MCHNVAPDVDMKMGSIRQTVMNHFHISEHGACRISSKDCHMYCTITHNLNRQLSAPILFTVIGPFYFRKTTYQVTVHISALCDWTPEQYDEYRLDMLKDARMQVVPFVPISTRLLQLVGHYLNFYLPSLSACSFIAKACAAKAKKGSLPELFPTINQWLRTHLCVLVVSRWMV